MGIIGANNPPIQDPVTPDPYGPYYEPQADPAPETYYEEPAGEIRGLSEAERLDPNEIQVTIADKRTPIVVLFGPPASGKTMLLIRLTRWLQGQGYTVIPDKTFRPSTDLHYKEICDDFNLLVSSPEAVPSTNVISFMLLKVVDRNRRPVCQILEAPGEHYFDPGNPKAGFPSYVNNIIDNDNRKIWLLMLEPNWLDQSDRDALVDRFRLLKTRTKLSDKFCLVLSKIDLSDAVLSRGVVNTSIARREFGNLYPGLYELFKNLNPITSIWQPYRADLVPFQSGTFSLTAKGTKTFQNGPNEYVARLWKSLLKYSRG